MLAILTLVACLQVEHKFLHHEDPKEDPGIEAANNVIASAGRESEDFSKFLNQVKSSETVLSESLAASKKRAGELEEQDSRDKAALVHAKEAFAKQIKQVEVKLVEKVHKVEAENAELRKQLDRANLNVQLHAKAEQDLKTRLQEMGKVFSNQEEKVKDILTASSSVQQALKEQDKSSEEARAEHAEVVQEVAQDHAEEELALEDKEEKAPEPAEPAVEPAAEPEPAAAEPAAEEPEPEKKEAEVPEAKPTTVQLVRTPAHEAKAKKEPEPAEKEDKEKDDSNPLDSLASEVDTLAADASSGEEPKAAEPKAAKDAKPDQVVKGKGFAAESSDLLDSAGDDLENLVKQ